MSSYVIFWNLVFRLVIWEMIIFWKRETEKNLWKHRNHTGATEYPDSMLEYLEKEAENKSILGPFKCNPFKTPIKISPVNSAPKKDTEERRVIYI